METLLDSKKFGPFTVEIHSDNDCESPLLYNDLVKCYEYGRHQEYRSTEFISGGEEGFEQYLATLIHPDFPEDTSYVMNEHRQAIINKHFARSQVPTQGHSWLEIVVNIKEWQKEGSCKTAKEFVDSVAETYRSWLEGECVGFVVKDEDGNDLDSCWGFYSWEDAYNSAKETFPTRNDQYYFDVSENIA